MRSIDDRRWKAVLARDASRDGTFVTAVLTTGIYCRPSCPARHPRPENVRFYAGPDEAERAGFRACRRCRPRDERRPDTAATLVPRVCRYLEENRDERVTLADLARDLGMSPHHLQRTFKRATGVSPRQYAEALRLGRLKQRLQRKEPVTMALYEAGYGSSSRLYERSSSRLGMTPGAYRAGGRGAVIRYAIARTPIGRVMVAATDRGVCSVRIGEPAEAMERALRREFPEATLRRDRAGLASWIERLASHLGGREPRIDLPLDVRGTAFQWKVWEALRAIPYGETKSYREVARSIGKPRAARAVGRACATNPVAILIPCHRVVREDGGLGGFAYGLPVKERILESERRGSGSRARRRRQAESVRMPRPIA
jgi:AraC family transcriptional regulator of adaptative response/methylated-DNA-[protein]-cysteine methyltransferase